MGSGSWSVRRHGGHGLVGHVYGVVEICALPGAAEARHQRNAEVGQRHRIAGLQLGGLPPGPHGGLQIRQVSRTVEPDPQRGAEVVQPSAPAGDEVGRPAIGVHGAVEVGPLS
ncbi:hypothetical protein ACIBO5_23795 [Nonomuraea angiospora]|uniref:hypothetical protein n=1 Tax=Nonomuraea angiospora TaxID=46172 RepID=UPI0029B3C078|nr:hypothetical protein [Nonomuraea angiospora]MDX3104630.1 hypothetical protein [Nonomuraea angiospora]